jgi:hypothetical protein
MTNTLESDEAYARRLQAQELGFYRMADTPDAQTPLVVIFLKLIFFQLIILIFLYIYFVIVFSFQQHRVANMNSQNNVINARMNEITSSWTTVGIICAINLPQVLATIIVLSVHWNTDHACDPTHELRWKIWAIVAALRMFIYCIVVIIMQYMKNQLQERPELLNRWKNICNTLDGCALIWFVLGNLWLIGEDAHSSCSHPEKSPIYDVCLSMLIFNYIQFCLPCIAAIILIPIFCFCTPCIIRLLARLQDPRITQGADQHSIDSLPLVTVTPELFQNGQETTCPICINEMNMGESVRSLRCSHIFHQQVKSLILTHSLSLTSTHSLTLSVVSYI